VGSGGGPSHCGHRRRIQRRRGNRGRLLHDPADADRRTVIWPETLLDATLTVPDDAKVALIQEATFDHGGNPVNWWRIETRTPTTSGVPIQYRLALAPLPTARNPLETVSPSA